MDFVFNTLQMAKKDVKDTRSASLALARAKQIKTVAANFFFVYEEFSRELQKEANSLFPSDDTTTPL